MRKSMLSRAIAMGMALVIAVGMLPGTAFAETDHTAYSTPEFEAQYTYTGDDLGAVWSKEATVFRVWAPTADSVKVNLYESGTAGTEDLIEQIEMAPDANGTWVVTRMGDLNGVYYTYEVEVDGMVNEACDPYARTTGVNGKRAMVIDLDSTDPEGWAEDRDPHYDGNVTDAVIYELHVRDLSSDLSSGITNTGKFLGLIEEGTVNGQGISTGLIAFRKAHPALRMTDAAEVESKIKPLGGVDFNVVACHIGSGANGEESEIIAIFNPCREASAVKLPEGQWNICIDAENAGVASLGVAEGEVQVAPISAMVLVKGELPAVVETEVREMSDLEMMLPVVLGALTACAVFIFLNSRRKMK